MMAAIRRLLRLEKPAKTFWEVEPAPRDPDVEGEIKRAHTELVKDVLKVEQRSWEIRRDLVAGVISHLSGGQ